MLIQKHFRSLWLVLLFATEALMDRAPFFMPNTGDMSHLEVSEATPVGTPVYQLRAVDPDGGPIQYSISGTRLSVDPQTGVITLREKIDREKQPLIEVVISATDTADNTASLRRLVQVADVNDNAPQFHGRPYSVQVKENAAVGYRLPLNIKITDADLGRNAEINVECERDGGTRCEHFKLITERQNEGEYQVDILIDKPLDYETRSAHVLTLRAKDSGDIRLSGAATVAITVLDVQDRLPEFLDAPYSAAVIESAPPGTSVLEIAARDGDSGESRREVHLSILGDILNYFKLMPRESSSNGISRATLVTSNISPLDREHPVVQQSGGVYTFDIVATEFDPENSYDTGDSSYSQVTVIITDADDQLPEFDSPVYSASVRENILPGDQVPGLAITVTDGDVGTNSRYYLRLRDADDYQPGAANALKVSPERGEGRTPLLIRISNPSLLDYEMGVRKLSVEIVASKEPNGEPLATAQINLKVLDANDHAPQFSRNTFRYHIPEDAPIGTRIDNEDNFLLAEDEDDGDFGKITYAVRGFGAGVFATDSENGGLRVAAPLDREKQAAYTLAVEARDGGGRITQVNVHVDVQDVNDNAPQFEQREYSRVVREGATTFDPQLFIRATDADGEQQGGGRVIYTLDDTSSEWEDVFSVEPDSGEIKMIRPVISTDAPRGQYELQIRATDTGIPPLYNTTRVVIRVGLVGNQRPAWRGAERDRLYRAELPETAPAGHLVTTIRAHDPDGPDSLVRYRLAGGREDNFVLDELTGELRVSTDARLDRDAENSVSTFDVLVSAVDGGPGPLKETATATVRVTILDINDEPPRFPSQNLTGYVSERAAKGTKILRIRAMDPDEGSEVRYSIGEVRALDEAGLPVRPTITYDPRKTITIDELTGELKIGGPLDHRLAAVLLVQVIATDKVAPPGEKQKSSTDATIYVQVHEDDSPVFSNEGWSHSRPELHVQLEEERPIGTRVLELKAQDPRNGRPISRFQVSNSKTDALTVVPDGEILLTRRVDYERPGDKLLELTVEALAEDGRKAEAHIFVHVIDLNDNAPRFDQNEYEIDIPESARHPQIVITVQAVDKDANDTAEERNRGYGVVTYSLGGGNGGPFELNANTGEIRIIRGAILDRERQAQHVLEVTARDGGGRKATSIVKITVTDVNDNAPRWVTLTSTGELTAVVPENSAPGERAVDLQAIDPDLDEGGEIYYEVLDEGEATGLFTLDSQSGRLEVARPLTGKGRTEPYILTVRARDGGDLFSDAPLHLYVGDVSANDGVPEWVKPTSDEEAKISENATVGSVVYRAKAIDPDDPRTPSGRVTYTLLDGEGPSTTTFAIDSDTGLVTLRKPLDREKQDHYTLVLVASDGGTPPQQASRVLQILITDVDDNPPRFNRLPDDPPQLLEIDEEVPIGTHIGRVQAQDPDLNENAAISYHLINGNDLGLFSIKDDGSIISSGRLDREEQSQHLLTVRCTKRQVSVPRKQYFNRLDPAELQVLIRLRDVDDNEPQFVNGENVTVGVRAWTQADALVTRLEAHDADTTTTSIEYRLAGGEFISGEFDLSDEETGSVINISEVFRFDTTTGEVRTIRPLSPFTDGMFLIHAEARSGERTVISNVVIHVARDRDLLRWVFSRPPSDVRRDMVEFEEAITGILNNEVRPLTYDARFLARRDGSLDFGSTGACFSLIPVDDSSSGTLSREAALRVLNEHEDDLRKLYHSSRVTAVERCDGASRNEGTIGGLPRATTAQAWLLAVALFVGIAGLVSCCVLCCMHCSYRRRTKKRMRLLHEASTMHPVIYPEPLYST